ncbi:hypothetical protein GGI09_002646, partial [Coemansia sp. S100]
SCALSTRAVWPTRSFVHGQSLECTLARDSDRTTHCYRLCATLLELKSWSLVCLRSNESVS